MADADATTIAVRRVTCANDFRVLDAATLVHFVVLSGSDAARSDAAELEAFLIDRTDGLGNLSENERLASDEAALGYVRRLEARGCVVCVGIDQADLRFDDDLARTRTWHMGCLAVAALPDAPETVTVQHD